MTTTSKFNPIFETGKATPENLYSIMEGRTCQITDKGQYFETDIPEWFPAQSAFDSPGLAREALDELCTKFGPDAILGKVMSQFLIDFRAACRAKVGEDFDPAKWTPKLAPVKKPDELTKMVSGLEQLAKKAGLTVEQLLAAYSAK